MNSLLGLIVGDVIPLLSHPHKFMHFSFINSTIQLSSSSSTFDRIIVDVFYQTFSYT